MGNRIGVDISGSLVRIACLCHPQWNDEASIHESQGTGSYDGSHKPDFVPTDEATSLAGGGCCAYRRKTHAVASPQEVAIREYLDVAPVWGPPRTFCYSVGGPFPGKAVCFVIDWANIEDAVQQAIPFLREHSASVEATGSGAPRLRDLLATKFPSINLTLQFHREISCILEALDFLVCQVPGACFRYARTHKALNSVLPDDKNYLAVPLEGEERALFYPFLLVNLKAGVSFHRVTAPNESERVGGSTIGGATFMGLMTLLCRSISSPLDAFLLAQSGDNSTTDMLVGDIYGGDYAAIGLKETTIASSFGRLQSACPKSVKRTEAWMPRWGLKPVGRWSPQVASRVSGAKETRRRDDSMTASEPSSNEGSDRAGAARKENANKPLPKVITSTFELTVPQGKAPKRGDHSRKADSSNQVLVEGRLRPPGHPVSSAELIEGCDLRDLPGLAAGKAGKPHLSETWRSDATECASTAARSEFECATASEAATVIEETADSEVPAPPLLLSTPFFPSRNNCGNPLCCCCGLQRWAQCEPSEAAAVAAAGFLGEVTTDLVSSSVGDDGNASPNCGPCDFFSASRGLGVADLKDPETGRFKFRQARGEASEADVARSVLTMMSYNVAQQAYLNSVIHDCSRIVLVGYYLEMPGYLSSIQHCIDFWSGGKCKINFVRLATNLGALGASLRTRRRASGAYLLDYISDDKVPAPHRMMYHLQQAFADTAPKS